MAPLPEEIKKQEIVDQLTWDDSVNANEIKIDVQDGNVQLKGKVHNYAAKLAATRDAFRVGGVRSVENYLQIEFPPADVLPEDKEIASNIKNMLELNSNIAANDISVESNDHVVTLQGTVPTYWEKYLAGDIANSATGVIEVINSLDVVLTKNIVDAEIENDIRNAFIRSSLVDEGKINVTVDAGVARLSGSVSSYPVKREAIDIAIYTAGVIDIIDEVTIG